MSSRDTENATEVPKGRLRVARDAILGYSLKI